MKQIYSIMFFISLALTLGAVLAFIVFGLRLGVDFEGGAVMEISFKKGDLPAVAEFNALIDNIDNVDSMASSFSGERTMIVRLNEIDEVTHQNILQAVSDRYGEITERRFDAIGPSVGQELKNKSITAMVILLIVITAYIALVFRKLSRVLSPWAMSMATIIALLHDVLIPIGVFAVLGKYLGIEVSAVFVAAILTILGYSVSDSVVVFDRVRENVLRFGAKENFGSLVHKSIMQTLSRSLNTTFTTLLPLFAIYFFGGESVKYFALALIIGIFLGAYSSIFVASPVLVWWSRQRNR